MTQFTFNPTAATPDTIDWSTASDWVPQTVPNAADANVVVPEITYDGEPYEFSLMISQGESFLANSLTVTTQILTVFGALTVDSALTLAGQTNLAMSGGSLTIGGLSDDVDDQIEGSGSRSPLWVRSILRRGLRPTR